MCAKHGRQHDFKQHFAAGWRRAMAELQPLAVDGFYAGGGVEQNRPRGGTKASKK